jgi:DNA-binding NarL/FixJ family response regulator
MPNACGGILIYALLDDISPPISYTLRHPGLILIIYRSEDMHILLADKQAEVRSALRFLLGQELGMSVVGEVAEASALLTQAAAVQPDVVLLDWELPGLLATNLLSALHSGGRLTIVIALSGRPEARRAALDAGVDAFVSKGDPPERLLAILYAVRDGGET